MAVLARLLGIPSRVAYGFTSGAPNGDEHWRVTTHDAHAWPELYFQGYGWLRFEPTPSRRHRAGHRVRALLLGHARHRGRAARPGDRADEQPGRRRRPAPRSPRPPAEHARSARPEPGGDAGRVRPRRGSTRGRSSASWWPALLVLALIAPLVRRGWWSGGGAGGTGPPDGGQRAGPPCPRVRRRLEGRIRARDVAWAHAAWQELRDDLMDYGAGYLPSESPRAVATRAGNGLVLAETGAGGARPDRHGGGAGQVRGRARRRVGAAGATASRCAGPSPPRCRAATRWRARLLPASVLGPALSARSRRRPTRTAARIGPEWLGRFRG